MSAKDALGSGQAPNSFLFETIAEYLVRQRLPLKGAHVDLAYGGEEPRVAEQVDGAVVFVRRKKHNPEDTDKGHQTTGLLLEFGQGMLCFDL